MIQNFTPFADRFPYFNFSYRSNLCNLRNLRILFNLWIYLQ
jgi:hypothetical protein